MDNKTEFDYAKFYAENADFHSYVDAYAAHYQNGVRISVETALTHKLVKDYADWLMEMTEDDATRSN